MFDWKKRVQILRAENALRDGRLDEAYSIASEAELRGWRACQVILEKLVDPLLDRAAAHLAQGRPRDALADLERAQAAGGNRPRAAELRAQIGQRLEAELREEARGRDLLASARRHLARGSLGAGKALLEAVEAEDPETEKLKREAARREERAREACAHADLLLREGALLEALRAAGEAQAASAGFPDLGALCLKLKAAAVAGLDRALSEGSLAAAEDLHSHLLRVCGESLETRRAGEALDLCREAAARVEAGDHGAARAAVLRLSELLPRAGWVEASAAALEKIAEGLQALSAGPLRSAGLPGGGAAPARPAAGRASPPRLQPLPGSAPALDGLSPARFLLLVDGVGSYLVLRADRVRVGRAGSSARPDIAVAADITGQQAEVLRVDDDYFIAAHGSVEVNGRKVDRKLLADGDRIKLAPRCELVFRTPTRLSSSAVLSLAGGQRIEGDVRQVVLLDHHLVMGPGEGCHVRLGGGASRILLCAEERGLVLRSDEEVVVDGRAVGREAVVRAPARVQVGEVTFAVTPLEG